MESIEFLWDTNIVIYYLHQLFPPSAEAYIDDVIANHQPAISSISEIELLCWDSENKKAINILKNFVYDAQIYELESEVKSTTIEVRKDFKIKLPDAIIAATAIAYNLKLLTRNKKDFYKVTGLEVINPFNF